jgi:hypothetical protein
MKEKHNYLLMGVVSTLLLAGCCTSRHPTEWEYKVSAASDATMGTEAAFLNDQAKQGWIFIQTEQGRFFFKRAKK